MKEGLVCSTCASAFAFANGARVCFNKLLSAAPPSLTRTQGRTNFRSLPNEIGNLKV